VAQVNKSKTTLFLFLKMSNIKSIALRLKIYILKSVLLFNKIYMGENKPIGITCKVSVSLHSFLRQLKEEKRIKSYTSLLLFIAQENGYKIKPEDM